MSTDFFKNKYGTEFEVLRLDRFTRILQRDNIVCCHLYRMDDREVGETIDAYFLGKKQ
jgi:hypothetical protein